MGLAAHNYHSANEVLPPAYLLDRFGRPNHSWRTRLLPYMELASHYNQVNFDVSWDAEENQTIRSTRINTFLRPEDASAEGPPLAKFLAVIGPQTPFPRASGTTFGQATDGLSTTILFGEVAESDIVWMEPRDLVFQTMDFRVKAPRKKMGYGSPYSRARVVMMDGMVRAVPEPIAPGVVRALVTSTGGEPVVDDGVRWSLAAQPQSDGTRVAPSKPPTWKVVPGDAG